ncbi:MAG TPA: hypothetical protein VFU80_02280 [Sphingomicrobium sp.]|nr:hypothetical protein [Sphingomicrobium sp.]
MTEESARVAEARRRAEEARAKFWASFDEMLDFAQDIQRKLEPSHLARDAWEAAKSKGADIAEDAVDAVRKRPVATGSAVAALALFIAREPLMDLASKLMSSNGKKKPSKGRRAGTKARKKAVEKVDE